MRRRSYLMLAATGSFLFAGCSDTNNDSNGSSTSTDNGGTESESTPGAESDSDDSEPAEYRIEADVTEEVEGGEEFTVTWTITNEGEGTGDGPAQYGLDFSVEGQSGWEPIFEDEIELEPGESESDESDPISYWRSVTIQWEFWINGPGSGEQVDAHETRIVTPERNWGQTFDIPVGIKLTPGEPSFAGRYTYENFSGERATHRADEGMQFVFIDLTAENASDQTRQSPNRLGFQLVADNRQYEPIPLTEYEREDAYRGLNELTSGVIEEGVLPYQIPEGIDTVELFHNEGAGDTEWEVIWN